MVQRVLFIRLSALGDIVNTLPALALLRLRLPGTLVDWAVEDRFAPFVRLVEGVDQVLSFPRRRLARPSLSATRALLEHSRALRRTVYDAAIDFQGNLKGAAHLVRCRAALKVGPDAPASREGAHWLSRQTVPIPAGCHRAVRALALLGPLGVLAEPLPLRPPLPDAWRAVVADEPEAAARAARRLAEAQGAPRVLLHPGTSSFGAFKRWPARRFGELSRLLREQLDAAVFISHGPGEEELARAVAAVDPGARFLAPEDGIAGLVALARRMDLVVAADSGPLLVAAALGVRTVALFGPKDPAVYAPPFAGGSVVRHAVPCSPCSLRRCDDPICMTRLDPAEVLAACASQLAAAAAARRP